MIIETEKEIMSPSNIKADEWNQFLSSAVNQSFEGIAIADLDHKLIYVNPAWAKMHGWDSGEELIGKSIKIFHNRQQMEEEVKPFIRVVNEKGANKGEVGHVRKDGSLFPAMMTSTLIRDAQKIPVAILGIVQDITERKQIEMALVAEKQRLAESQRIAHIGSFQYNMVTQHHVYWSKEIFNLFGLDPEKDRGRIDLFFSMLHPDDQPLIEKALNETKNLHKPYNVEFRLIRKDGATRIFHTQGELMPDSYGNPVILSGTTQDITERRNSEEELSKYRDHLEELVAKRTAALEQKTIGLEESNIALKVLMKQRETDKKELEKNILFNVNKLIGPSLEKLKKITSDNNQKVYLEIIKSNLNEIISPFAPGLSANLSKLTPAEMQIADFIRQGRTTKEIASLLGLSPSTIAAHRQNIRKKLALTNKEKNLRTVLTANSQ